MMQEREPSLLGSSDLQRFESKILKVRDGCWFWQAAVVNGYGKFWLRGKSHGAHRVAYEHWVGPIPEALVIDHHCLQKACVNPAHLEPVTAVENSHRSDRGARRQMRCKMGHPLAGDNLYTSRGKRECKECRRKRTRESWERNWKKTPELRAIEQQQREADAFWKKVELREGSDCWHWVGAKLPTGWAKFRNTYGHLWAYGHFIGLIPEGKVLTPACENRSCVKPEHYQPTQRNPKRRQTHCKREHELIGDNLKIGRLGQRICRECARIRKRRNYEESKLRRS